MSLTITNDAQLTKLIESNEFRSIRELIFKGIKWQPIHLLDKNMNPLIQILQYQFDSLTSIAFEMCELDDVFLKLLSECMHMAALKKLVISGSDNNISNTGIQHLSESKSINSLKNFGLFNINIEFDSLFYILYGVNNFKTLEQFYLSHDSFVKPFTLKNSIGERKNSLKVLKMSKVNMSSNTNFSKMLLKILNPKYLTTLSLKNCLLEPEGCKIISESPSLVNLQYLNLRYSLILTEGLIHISKSKNLKKLKYLNIKDNLIDLGSFNIFALHSNFPNLNQLLIADSTESINSDICTALKQREWKRLSLDIQTSVPFQCCLLESIAANPNLLRLEKLTMKNLILTTLSARLFFFSPNVRNLHSIAFKHINLANKAIKFLAYSNYSPKLNKLVLRDCNLTSKSLKYISESKNMRNLVHLDVSRNRMKSRVMYYLSKSAFIDRLGTLILNHNDLSEYSGWSDFSKSSKLKTIQMLKLKATSISGRSLDALCRSDNLMSLKSLDVRKNATITQDSRDSLADLIKVKSLKELHLSAENVTNEVVEDLIHILQNTQIIYDFV